MATCNDVPILEISDGTTTINLIEANSGIFVTAWDPAISGPKDDGIWQSGSFSDGRRLAVRKFANAIETMTCQVRNHNQDTLITTTQELRRLLEKAVSYWTTSWQTGPVWIHARSAGETNERWAIIHDYRTPNDGYPYGDVWTGISNAAIDDFALVLERGHWQDVEPGSSTCVQISAQQDYYIAPYNDFSPLQSSDDATIDDGIGTIDLAGDLVIGRDAGVGLFSCGVLFNNVTIPNGTTVTQAFVRFVASATDLNNNCNVTIAAEDVDSAATFTTYANFSGRARTAATVAWNSIVGMTQGNTYYTPDLASVVNSVFSRPGWASGNDLVIFLDNNASDANALRYLAAWDHATYSEPILYVRYANGDTATFGRAATCANEVYVANKHNRAQITDIYHYDASTGLFSTNLQGAALPYALLPATPAVGDIAYFGIDTSLTDSGPFCSLVFDIGTAIADVTTAVWEYYNGAWVALTIQDSTNAAGLMTGTAFDTTGVSAAAWVTPSDWVTVAINGITGYWIRLRVTAIGAAPTPPTQQNRNIYTVVVPSIDIDEAQCNGDIPVILRLQAENWSDGTTVSRESNRIIYGSRSVSRGSGFQAYLNASDEQNGTGITITPGPDAAFSTNVTAPTGRTVVISNVPAAWTNELFWIISSAYTHNYHGEFRVFVRAHHTSGGAGTVKMKLYVSWAGSYTSSQVVFDSTGDWQILDFGKLNLPIGNFPQNQDNYDSYLALMTYGNNAADIEIYDLVLIPTDEYAGDIVMSPSDPAKKLGFRGSALHSELDIGVVPFPNRPDYGALRLSSGAYYAECLIISPSPISLQSRADQRMYFLQTRYPSTTIYSNPEVLTSLSLDAAHRYLSMRGTR